MNRLIFLLLFFACLNVWAQPEGRVFKIIPAPGDPGQWDSWTDSLRQARTKIKKEISYDDFLYRDPDFKWAAACYNIYFLMLFDNAIYDPVTGKFQVDKFLNQVNKDFGIIDGIVLWHAYPRIGIDPKDQFDHYRDFPGGLEGLRRLVEAFHAHGIKVFLDYNPWDRGTRREGRRDVDLLSEIVKITGADGIFLDTLMEGEADFRTSLNNARPGVVLESELALPVDRIYDHHMSWAQWFDDSHVPGILWNKWFERRHMMHQIRRWDHDHSSELQIAWMNGSGMLLWENVFGTWMPWNARDKSWLRLMTPVQRKFSFLFTGEGWMPRFPVLMDQVFASLWFDDHFKLWTVVNRSEDWKSGLLMKMPRDSTLRYFDLFSGTEIKPVVDDSMQIELAIGPRGLGCVLATDSTGTGPWLRDFLSGQRKRMEGFEKTSASEEGREIFIAPNVKLHSGKIPRDMAGVFNIPDSIRVTYRQRECGFYTHVGYTPPPDRIHREVAFKKSVRTGKYAIDLTPVTNRQYYTFITRSGYVPMDTTNFLKHWKQGKPEPGTYDHPVVYVSLEDARAYAAWAEKRLPTEEEWQIAAQGKEITEYPWGDRFDKRKCNYGQFGGTSPVKKFKAGRSSYGCYDMCGNTWEWTAGERSDGHTRYAILKGGSWFRAEGSDWYFEGGPQPAARSAKYILFWPGLDRSATIGFRCAVDVID